MRGRGGPKFIGGRKVLENDEEFPVLGSQRGHELDESHEGSIKHESPIIKSEPQRNIMDGLHRGE